MIKLDRTVTEENIDHFQQNKPSLIADDFELMKIDRDTTYMILLSRGVFKWFAVRRDLIEYKDRLKVEIRETIEQIKEIKQENRWNKDETLRLSYQLGELRGKLKVLESCRAKLKEMCHSSRFRAPLSCFDQEAHSFLLRLKKENKEEKK